MARAVKDQLREAAVVQRRLVMVTILSIALLAILIARLYNLQVQQYARFTELATKNRVNTHPIGPVRGLIYDRNGELLASNVRDFQINVTPNQVEDMQALIASVQAVIELDEDDLAAFMKLVKRRPSFETQILTTGLTQQQAAAFSAIQHRIVGAELKASFRRYYPQGALTGHVVGYVGRINQKDVAKIDKQTYRGTNYIGKLGVEASYESQLLGIAGSEQIETNAHGRQVRSLNRQLPITGSTLHLSLDVPLQRKAQSLLDNYEGAVVAIDPRNGEILAFVSNPSYDPNPFVNGIGSKAYSSLRTSERRPLLNRALNGRYAPGSTIKGFMGLIGMKNGISPKVKVNAPGWYSLPNSRHRYRCWKKVGHGRVDLHDAIAQSCDVYFYRLANRLGIDKLHAGMTEFGFGLETNVDIPNEPSGLMPSAAWKRRTRGQPWYPGETVITGIGQGYMLVTPIQLASAVATLANRGKPVQPHFVVSTEAQGGELKRMQYPDLEPVEGISPAAYAEVIQAMQDVVHGPRGTARRQGAQIPFLMAGKTGTAQVKSIAQGARYDKNVEKKYRDHSLFVAFAPVDKPRIAIAVVVEHGGSGSKVAAPIAREIVDYYLVDRLHLFSRKAEKDTRNAG